MPTYNGRKDKAESFSTPTERSLSNYQNKSTDLKYVKALDIIIRSIEGACVAHVITLTNTKVALEK